MDSPDLVLFAQFLLEKGHAFLKEALQEMHDNDNHRAQKWKISTVIEANVQLGRNIEDMSAFTSVLEGDMADAVVDDYETRFNEFFWGL
ncbi:MAG: hypothetical protein DRH26_02270 [Deltaproteobacteria bacterium]|nr:MAG: hypothetical protein DRH26_02270 [Deltaproteobacteria bacterium]